MNVKDLKERLEKLSQEAEIMIEDGEEIILIDGITTHIPLTGESVYYTIRPAYYDNAE